MRRGLTSWISKLWNKKENGMTKFCQIIGKFIHFYRAAHLLFKSSIVPISYNKKMKFHTCRQCFAKFRVQNFPDILYTIPAGL